MTGCSGVQAMCFGHFQSTAITYVRTTIQLTRREASMFIQCPNLLCSLTSELVNWHGVNCNCIQKIQETDPMFNECKLSQHMY